VVNAKRRRRTKTLFLYSVYAEYPQHKVAIDSTSQTVKNNMNTHDLAGKRSHDPPLETGVYGYDVEKTEEHNGGKMSRVGGGVWASRWSLSRAMPSNTGHVPGRR